MAIDAKWHRTDLKRGDVVVALQNLDEEGANVKAGMKGVVFEETNAYKDDGGPMVRWENNGCCNVYGDQVAKLKER